MTVVIDLSTLYEGTAKLDRLEAYVTEALRRSGEGNDVIITGAAPVWLYLKIAHALHGKVKKLIYRSPVSGDLEIFNHDPF